MIHSFDVSCQEASFAKKVFTLIDMADKGRC